MVGRVRLAGLALLALAPAACTAPTWGNGTGTAAAAPCPTLERASAWVNRMPGPDPSERRVQVLLRFAEEGYWALAPEPADGEGTARLRLVPAHGGIPGQASARLPADPLPRAIEILCDGETVTVIEAIETVM